jgi:SAM-dependent methyltransferase
LTFFPSSPRQRFKLPEADLLQPNGPDDPLPYYYKPFIGRIYRARIEQALSLLTPPYKSILEIGYGSGLLLPSLCQMGESVSGVDLQTSPDKLKEPLDKLGIDCTLIQGDIADQHFAEGSFDLIVAISIFEHIADLRPPLEQIKKLLSPSGHLLVGMPRVDRYMDVAFRGIGYNNINDHHVTDYKQCRGAAGKYFELIRFTYLPELLPRCCGLYYNMLFEKRESWAGVGGRYITFSSRNSDSSPHRKI